MHRKHREQHKLANVGWLRAAVLGANDGIVSTSSLVLGVAASQASHHAILVAGIAGLAAGAMSMATGEYVSVQSQADTEHAALAVEQSELREDPQAEQRELAGIYRKRGLDQALAQQVAAQLTAHDALGAHSRDELGLTDVLAARPLQAALASACSFSIGAALPVAVVLLSPANWLITMVAVCSLVFLALLGGIAAKVGGASIWKGVLRVGFWSALSMGVTTAIGAMTGTGS